MNILYIRFRAIAQATEDEDKVEAALKFTTASENVKKTRVEGHFGNMTVLMVVAVERKRDIMSFLQRLKNAGILEILAEDVERRIDEECVLHFRLDKQGAHLEELKIAHGKDVIDCGMKIAAYPAKKENAVNAALETFRKVLETDDKT